MIEEIDLLIGLSMEAKETQDSPAAIVQKARDLNIKVSSKLRKDIIMPIMQSANPGLTLDIKCKDFFSRQRMRRGAHL